MIRSAVQAMQATARTIQREQSLLEVEDRVTSIDEIFRLQGEEELRLAERRYHRGSRAETTAVVLGATRGKGLGELTADRPKMMVAVAGRPLLRRLADEFKRQGIHRLVAVTGYRAETVVVPGVETVRNPEYETTGELASLACALPAFGEEVLICYGDLLFRRYILRDLLEVPAELAIVVDAAFEQTRISGTPDYAWCTLPDDLEVWRKEVLLRELGIAPTRDGAPAHGRWIGLLRASGAGVTRVREAIAALQEQPDFTERTLPDLVNCLVRRGSPVQVQYVHGHWLDVNTIGDLEHADRFGDAG
jgi:phosphoenolpyruvate phosphomutase